MGVGLQGRVRNARGTDIVGWVDDEREGEGFGNVGGEEGLEESKQVRGGGRGFGAGIDEIVAIVRSIKVEVGET